MRQKEDRSTIEMFSLEWQVARSNDGHCCARKTSGYWKGYPCAAVPRWRCKSLLYCKAHVPMNEKADAL